LIEKSTEGSGLIYMRSSQLEARVKREMFELAPKPEFQPNPFFHTSQIAKQMEEV